MSIGHATGMESEPGVVKIARAACDTGSELRGVGAPGRTRTCDRLLRRQLLYPAELQAPTRTLCPIRVTYRTRLAVQVAAFLADSANPATRRGRRGGLA